MMRGCGPVIDVRNLVVDYGKGKKRHRAVNDVSFQVNPGETVGFIGPNGAGKSSTIKAILGFLFPVSGRVNVFGEAAGTVASRRRMGYLPEVALYYPFMKARELLELYGGLCGMTRAQLRSRIPSLLESVGLAGKGDVLLKQFSKGMQQRLGIAQAIIADPEALVFDELSSGLDPVGRHDLRSVLLSLKERGRTIFFSSHELTEVESLCDRVIIINRGQIVEESCVTDLVKPLNRFEVTFALPEGRKMETALSTRVEAAERTPEGFHCEIEGADEYGAFLHDLTGVGARIVSTRTHHMSLEDYFIQLVGHEESGERSEEGRE
jgi:ABC-2 type transport system ATP-binding protein